jgi:hypothetical protein
MNRLAHAAILLLITAAAPATAQELAGTFDQLRVLVRPGDTLTITDSAGQRVRGKLAELSGTTLVLDVSGAHHALQAIDIDTIRKRGPDSLKNGALTGLAIGAGVFGLAIGAATGHGTYAVAGALLYGGIGAGIGAGVDALIEGQRIVYARSTPTAAHFSIAPIVSRSRQGVLFTVGVGRH